MHAVPWRVWEDFKITWAHVPCTDTVKFFLALAKGGTRMAYGHRAIVIPVMVGLALRAAASAGAQVPGAPVLQNAFANPGLGVAVNFGAGSGQSFFGAAAGWGAVGGRVQLSGVAGVQSRRDESRGAYGGRLSAALWNTAGGSFGVGAFAGVGGAASTHDRDILDREFVNNPAIVAVPAGVSVGWRRPIGHTRGVSVYAAPFYQWTRIDSVTAETVSDFAVSGGVDFAFSPTFGITLGGQVGSLTASGQGAATFGAAIGFAPGRRK